MNTILMSILAIGGIGIVFGLILGYAGEKLKVYEDPKIAQIRDALPGANCGGCGFAGCDAFAAAVVLGEAKTNGCPVGGSSCASACAEIMGIESIEGVRETAFVRCVGDCEKAIDRYEYNGMNDCAAMAVLANTGKKGCVYGCLGGGNCVRKCEYDALSIVDGIAVIDSNKCVSCKMCVSACPKNLIEIKPYDHRVKVACMSKEAGKAVKSVCSAGCIGCKICVKQCEFDAIHVEDNLAKVDYEKCTQCEKCVLKCPTKVILDRL